MVNIAQIIQYKYPSANLGLGGDCTVSDDGSGAKITRWNEAKLGPQPTVESLETHRGAVEAAQAATRRYQEVRAQLGAIMARVSSLNKLVRVYPLKPVIANAFDSQMPLPVVKHLIANFDVSDDLELSALKAEMLKLL